MRPMIVMFKENLWDPWTTYKIVHNPAEAAIATADCLSIYRAIEVKIVPVNKLHLLIERKVNYEMRSVAM